MTKRFDQILDQCLSDMLIKGKRLDECLARHPDDAEALKPYLVTADRIAEATRTVAPDSTAKERARRWLEAASQPQQDKGSAPIA